MTATAQPLAPVVERLRSIAASLPQDDGVACFARLYLEVTEGVQERLRGQTFSDAVFLARLDVVFAGLFFDRLETSRAWAPLLEARHRRGIAPIQFAVAGMNAHINADLPVALVSTCRELGLDLEPQHGDFLRVNRVLAEVEAAVREEYVPRRLRLLARIVHRFDRVDDVVAMWSVERARDAAWTNAEALWALGGDPQLAQSFVLTLERSVGLAGRGLLVPAESWLAKVARRLGLSH